MAEDDFGPRRDFQADGTSSDGHAAVGTSARGGLHTPHVRPPRAVRDRPQNRTALRLRLRPRLPGYHPKFAMDFMLVTMQTERRNVLVSVRQVGDRLAGEVGR